MENYADMDFYNKIDFIAGTVRGTEKMALLAEELDELADAAEIFKNTIKEKRTKRGRRYTMNQYAMERMISEFADVMAVMMCTFHPEDLKYAMEWADMQIENTRIRTGADLKKELNELIFACKALRTMAFKHRRIGSKDNPTDRTREYVNMMIGVHIPLMIAEMFIIMHPEQVPEWDKKLDSKINRWYDRLMKMQGSDENEQE